MAPIETCQIRLTMQRQPSVNPDGDLGETTETLRQFWRGWGEMWRNAVISPGAPETTRRDESSAKPLRELA